MFLIQFLIVLLVLKIAGYFIVRKSAPVPKANAGNLLAPRVDIIVPMYNEEKVILKTIENLLNISYSNFKVIVIDDGSTDDSLGLVQQHFGSNEAVNILHISNQGKAHALNVAIQASTSKYVFCIDADTLVMPNIVDVVLPYFSDEQVVAVAGSIKVGNADNLITKAQYFEYITTQNYERTVFSGVNGIMVVPGAIGAFKRAVIADTGGYNSDTLAEDTEITVKMICQNYRIRNADEAIGFTEAPASFKMFLKQRVRWKVGTMQVLVKYMKNAIFHQNKAISFLVLPYMWMFTLLLPFISAFADYYTIVAALNGHYDVLIYYLAFVVIDAMICFVILTKKGEKARLAQCIILRLLLRQLSFLTLILIIVRCFKGTLHQWDKVARYGTVSLEVKNDLL